MPRPHQQDFAQPSTWLRSHVLPGPVVSCGQAAAAKGIPLAHELKTLVLTTDSGLAVAHVRGDDRLSLRMVKRALGHDQSRLADGETLEGLGMSPGTVQPFAPPLLELVHLVDDRVMDLPWVTTNDGSLDHYVVFSPWLLHSLHDVRVTAIV